MKASLFVLCDRATVREGLLHVLGAGINVFGRPVLPAPLAVDLAIILTPDRVEEIPGEHQLLVTLRDEAGVEFAKVDAIFALGTQFDLIDPLPNIPFSIPLQNAAVPSYGFYEINGTFDGQQLAAIRFSVSKDPVPGTTQMLPPEQGDQAEG